MVELPSSRLLWHRHSVCTKSTVARIASQQASKLLRSLSTFVCLRSRSMSSLPPRPLTANMQRTTKSVSRSNELPSVIESTNSGSPSANPFQLSLSMLKIRSERLSGVPRG